MAIVPPVDTLRLAMVAGEASGDLLGGLLLGGLRQRWPHLVAQGIGGPAMAQQGFEAWWPHHTLSVHGFSWELLRRYRELVGIRRQLRERWLRERPSLMIGVDAPDFNLDLEAALRADGIRTLHFVSPSVWAWRPERMEKIRRSADAVLCIFPFEPELLQRHGIAAHYVGHPLAAVIPLEPDRLAARTALGLAPEAPVLALLPGSRPGEIAHLARRFLQATRLLCQRIPGLQCVLPAAPGLHTTLNALLGAEGLVERVRLLQGQSHAALAACDVTLVASGTATLEAALFKRPMVIAYHMGWVSWRLMQRKRLQPWVGLPNILSGEFVVPELLQDAATPQALADAVAAWLDPAAQPRVAALQQRFTDMHHLLRRDTARLATDAISTVLAA